MRAQRLARLERTLDLLSEAYRNLRADHKLLRVALDRQDNAICAIESQVRKQGDDMAALKANAGLIDYLQSEQASIEEQVDKVRVQQRSLENDFRATRLLCS